MGETSQLPGPGAPAVVVQQRPMQLPLVHEPHFLQFNGDIVGSAADAQLGSRQLTSGLGFLWTGLSIDSTSPLLTWRVYNSYFGDWIVEGGELIWLDTFSGEGVAGANKTPTPWPTGGGMYFPGSATVIVNCSDTSTSTNTVYFTMTGMRVRQGSQFEKDILREVRYISPQRGRE